MVVEPLSLLDRLQIAGRVINAIILREINSRFGESRLGYLWAFLSPMVGLVVLYIIFAFIRQRETEMPLALFLITGWFTYGFYQSMTSMISNSEASNRMLLMHPNVTRLDVMISRAALDTMTTFSLTLLAVLASALIEPIPFPDDLLLTVASFGAAGTFGMALGVTMGAISTYFPFAMNFVQPVNRLGFFLSGVLFTATMMPSWTYDYIKWNPLIHCIEGIRQGWFQSYQSPILDLTYTYSIAIPLLAVGLYLERRTRRGIKFG